MIAADTSSLIAYVRDDKGADVERFGFALAHKTLVLPPIVVLEALSDPNISASTQEFIDEIRTLDILPGFWRRAAKMRAQLLRNTLKAKLGDAMIAQSCIDYDVPLITRDKDFRHYAKHCGLKLYDKN